MQEKNGKKLLFRNIRLLIVPAAILCLTASLGLLFYSFLNRIPSNLYFLAEQEQEFDFGLPATGTVRAASAGQKSNIPDHGVSINLSNPVTMRTGRQENYDMEVRLFGVLPIKNIAIHIIEKRQLIPMGTPVGIYMESEGVLVIGVAEFETISGEMAAPAKEALKSGDYILAVNGEAIQKKEELAAAIEACGGDRVLLTVERSGKRNDVVITPQKNVSGQYKAGIWIRDNVQGVGTLTYLDGSGRFGALGHGIADVDTGVVLDARGGVLYQTEIVDLRKGEHGNPGEMTGRIIYDDQFILGEIRENSEQGIFGIGNDRIFDLAREEAVPIGLRQDIVLGEAQIICTVDREPRHYQVEITKIHLDHDNVNRGIELRVTDPELLQSTGGIIQGMSGSPILQNGKLIGAVTHVLVNAPERGYGIFIENMLEEGGL